ncbi:hypothetical protein ACLKA7_014258 [Drosophila subpalustris]
MIDLVSETPDELKKWTSGQEDSEWTMCGAQGELFMIRCSFGPLGWLARTKTSPGYRHGFWFEVNFSLVLHQFLHCHRFHLLATILFTRLEFMFTQKPRTETRLQVVAGCTLSDFGLECGFFMF